MLKVQEYLLNHSINDLAKDHGIYVRWSHKNPRKFTLNYDQIEAREDDVMAQECRALVMVCEPEMAGIVDRPLGPTRVYGMAFKRFFNHGQIYAAPVDFNDKNVKFWEKCDGTLIVCHYDFDLNQWCISTRSVPDNEMPVNGMDHSVTFISLFKRAFKDTNGHDFDTHFNGDKLYTYAFELCTPENQVVVYYSNYRLYLLGVRNNETLKELNPENYSAYLGIPTPETFKLNNVNEMIDFVSTRNPSEYEGLVVCDSNYHRVKVKNPGYLALSKIKDSVVKSRRSLLEIILLEKEDDVIPLVPEHIQKGIVEMKEKLRLFIHNMDKEYEELYSADRKTFAIAVQNGSGFLGPQMARWSGQCKSTHDWILTKKKEGTWQDSFLDMILEEMENM